ncbi:hypothetical protein [Streptomyces sp. I05A-00742]|uniref:hypothetical protein n=1 Tax=Streptomyces sp. I05A-00742 TaxID=2732853 RepID=UPI00148968AC|nr:hypothetical protein [Streptomyces sp. I05A-00742]
MKPRTFRLAPVVAAVTAGLLLAGSAGTAVAAPSEESPSPAGSASGSASGPATGSTPGESGQDDQESRPPQHAKKRGPYQSERECRQAGEKGVRDGKWQHYRCERDSYHHNWWWLYTW